MELSVGVGYRGDMVRILQCGRGLGLCPLPNGRAWETVVCVARYIELTPQICLAIWNIIGAISSIERCEIPEADDGANKLEGLVCDPPSCELAKDTRHKLEPPYADVIDIQKDSSLQSNFESSSGRNRRQVGQWLLNSGSNSKQSGQNLKDMGVFFGWIELGNMRDRQRGRTERPTFLDKFEFYEFYLWNSFFWATLVSGANPASAYVLLSIVTSLPTKTLVRSVH